MTESVEDVLAAAWSEYHIPGVACAISVKGSNRYVFTTGKLSHESDSAPVSRETYFDLASVTKVVTTYQWLLKCITRGLLTLDTPIRAILPNIVDWLGDVPIWRLANHTSGLAAHQHYYDDLGPPLLESGRFLDAKNRILTRIQNSKPVYAPGSRLVYSDLGYILLAEILGRASAPLSESWSELYGHSPDHLHWCPSRTTPTTAAVRQYASTEKCPWRNRLLCGEVHDDNCWTLGGVAGHAGTFGRVLDVHDIGEQFLAAYWGAPNRLGIDDTLVRKGFEQPYFYPDSDRVLGWQTRTPGASSSGELFGDASFGHLGYTGTSLWIDPDARVVATVLTNRVCPTRNNESIKTFRPRLHDALRRLINR